jgi:predicted NodU family carbamoyl transferase
VVAAIRSSFKKPRRSILIAYDSPFMILPRKCALRTQCHSVGDPRGRQRRPQTVEREINPLYYRLIDNSVKLRAFL